MNKHIQARAEILKERLAKRISIKKSMRVVTDCAIRHSKKQPLWENLPNSNPATNRDSYQEGYENTGEFQVVAQADDGEEAL